jgi:membrane associated rhomboid family serine protease
MFNNIPPVTKNLLLINVLLYFVLLFAIQSGYTSLPFKLSAHYFNSPTFEPYQMVTHMFVHSMTDIFHIIFNMLLLVMFGGHLERIWGPKRYFIFYVACGIGALILYNTIGMIEIYNLQKQLVSAGYNLDTLNYFISEQNFSEISYINGNSKDLLDNYVKLCLSSMAGASGAIFGLLAGFAILFPNTKLMLLFPPIPIKAKWLIGGYLAFEIYNSIYVSNDSIAHLAHVGGALVGIVMVLYWRKFDKQSFY